MRARSVRGRKLVNAGVTAIAGFAAVFGLFVLLFAPETKGQPLPEE